VTRRIASPWLLLAALLVVCGAVVGVLAYRRNRSVATVTDLMNRFPSADSVVLGIDVRTLRNAGVLDLLAGNRVMEEPDYKLFIEQTGFDYRQDLDYALVAFDRTGTQMFLRGRFDWRKLRDYVTTQQGTCRNAFCRLDGSRPERKVSFFPLRPDTMALAVGNDEWGASILQNKPKSRPSFTVPVRPVWLRVPAGALKNPENLPAGTRLFAEAMKDTEQLVISLGVGRGGLEADLEVTCKTAADASALSTQLQSLTAALGVLLAKNHQQANPRDLSGVLVAGKFWPEGRQVHGRWPVAPAFLEALAGGSL
jgi:hypothetical protein